MRVKNKEIRRRRHRKEQAQKAAVREIRATQGEKKPAVPKPKPPVKKAGSPKAASESRRPARAKAE